MSAPHAVLPHVGRNTEVLAHDFSAAGFDLRCRRRGDGSQRWLLKRDGVRVDLRLKPHTAVPGGVPGYLLELRLPRGITPGGRQRCTRVRELVMAVLEASFNVRMDPRVDPKISTGRLTAR